MKNNIQSINGLTIYNNFYIVVNNEEAQKFYDENGFIHRMTNDISLSEEEEAELEEGEEVYLFHPLSEEIFGDDRPSFDDQYTTYVIPYEYYDGHEELIELGVKLEGEFIGF